MSPSLPIRVLLVDDDEDEHVLIREIVRRVDGVRYVITSAYTAAQGLGALLTGEHDVALLDYRLGAEDGLSVLTQARAARCRTPVLLLTGLGNREVDHAAMAAGASDYLAKAELTPGALERAMRYAINQSAVLARLEDRTAELARSNHELEQFAAIVSHDLRGPMQTIASYADLLQQRYEGQLDEKARHMIGRLVGGVMRLDAMIDDLLDLARVSGPSVTGTVVSTEACLTQALADLDARLTDAGGRVVRATPLPDVPGSAALLTQLFANLVGNAVKFHGDAPPVVTVGASVASSGWTFEVCDNGVGIPPAELSRVFAMFHRGPSTADRPGTGIGLAICKKIVERHGGTLAVESTVGVGTCFRFTLPRRDPDRTVPPPAPVR